MKQFIRQLNVMFDYSDKDYISEYLVKLNKDLDTLQEASIQFDKSKVISFTETHNYNGHNIITLNNTPYSYDEYKPKIYLNDELVDENLYHINNFDIQFSYKLTLNVNDNIRVEYFRRVYEVYFYLETDIDINSVSTVIMPLINKSPYVGDHNVFN